jgi:Fur family ferric uptake transcriptional regulator
MDVERILRARGRRITPQRKLVCNIFQEHGGHLSADEIYHLARQKQPRLSLSTVYRTLDVLREIGLIIELHLDGDQLRYEMQRDEEHQHLVCLGCGRVVEFKCAHCARMHQDLAEQHGFRITGSRVELLGYCAECQRKRNK